MLYNYLKIIIRNFISDGMYTFIIVFGFAIGLSSILVIGQYISFELSFDQHVQDKDRIYYTYLKWKGDKDLDGKCFPAVAPFMTASIPEVQSCIRLLNVTAYDASTALVRRVENGKVIFQSQIDNLFLADPTALTFFSVPMVYGDAARALSGPNSVVITRTLAEKFFPGENPIDKILQFGASQWKITGVAENPVPNATFQFNGICSIQFLKQQGWDADKAWQNGDFETFAKLYAGVDYRAVERKINSLAIPLRPLEEQLKTKLSLHLYPFQDFHFFKHNNSSTAEGIQFSGDKKLLSYFAILSGLILTISLANYINLTTARALKRAKEVGLRKVNGASRNNLLTQFLIEFSFLNLISFLLAFTMAQILFPVFARAIGTRAIWIFWANPWFWLVAVSLFVFCTACSGIYPAFVLAGYNPSKVLKGNFTRSQSGISVRRVLVLIQFSLSIIMIMSIYVITNQLFFMQDKDLGISVDQVMVIRTNELDQAINRHAAYQQLKSKIGTLHSVISLSSTSAFPGSKIPRNMVFQLDSDKEKQSKGLLTNEVGENFFVTMGLELLYGRNFNTDSSGDSSHIVINEMATHELGFTESRAAIGAQLIFPETGKKYEVIGIIKDFNINLKEPAEGEIFYKHHFFFSNETPANFFLVKLSSQHLIQIVSTIEKEWKQLFPQTPFDYFFLDTYFDTFYNEEKRFAQVFAFFAIIGIAITCMGLFGLSLFDTNSRTKEIGIRKSLGGSVRSIMWLFSKAYMKLVLLASIIAAPIGMYVLNNWLSNYPHRINLAVDVVLLPFILMCSIAILTVGYHTYKAACVNPVKSLGGE